MGPNSRCYYCGGERDQEWDFRLKLKGEPMRPICQECLRDWPPDNA